MGLAASQARYLGLTARKNNVEFMGQQVNQKRTELANQSSEIAAQIADLEVPSYPSFAGTQYTTQIGGVPAVITAVSENTVGGTTIYQAAYYLTEKDPDTGEYKSGIKSFTKASDKDADGHYTWLKDGKNPQIDLSYIDEQKAQEYAEANYQNKKSQYDSKVALLRAKDDKIQHQDKVLELQLAELDTEQQALSTEMDAVTKVIDKNIDSTFKTFG